MKHQLWVNYPFKLVSMANENKYPTITPIYTQLCARSDDSNHLNMPDKFPLFTSHDCKTAVMLLPSPSLVAPLVQLLHYNVLQAIFFFLLFSVAKHEATLWTAWQHWQRGGENMVPQNCYNTCPRVRRIASKPV